ncbi:MAG: S8 family serine peptidase, partial [Acidobacteriota bacterium]
SLMDRAVHGPCWLALVPLMVALLAPIVAKAADMSPPAKLPENADPGLGPIFEQAGPEGRVKLWVIVQRDKGLATPNERARALDAFARTYDPHAIERRRLRRSRPGLFDVDDLPIPATWVEAIRVTGAEIVVESRWTPGVSAWVTRDELIHLASLPFVERLQPVARGGRRLPLDPVEPIAPSPSASAKSLVGFYGEAEEQLGQIGLIALHDRGYTGAGVRIGVLDTGYRRTHEVFNDPAHSLEVIAEWDFVNDDPNTAPELGDEWNQHEHGTVILGAIAAYQPNVLVGSAPDAAFILAKVEDVLAEYPLEEDWFAAGLEFIEQHGGDLATSSVVIFDHYSQQELDGQTSVMARAINTATDNGLHVCQGVGNNGHDADPATSTLVTPADAFRAITVGSVDDAGATAWFTSDGPTADGRQKPEVLARGVNTRTVSPWLDSGTDGRDGASMATPLVCGAVACLVQAHPSWSVEQLRTHLFLHSSRYLALGEPDPLFVDGFGIADALAANEEDCNGNGTADPIDLASGASGDCNGNALPDECDVASLHSADAAADGLPDECTECSTGPACPGEVANLQLSKQAPDLILAWDAALDAAEYSVRRDETAPSAGTTEVGRSPSSSWTDPNALLDPPDPAYYIVRGLTAGGVAGP